MTDTVASPTLVDAASAAYRNALEVIGAVEPRVADAIARGARRPARLAQADRQRELRLARPCCSRWATGLSDKYAEGTIGHRFYAGCQNVDTVEALAAEHARELFGAAHAYVQPHSGIDANLVAFWAVLAQRVESPALAEAGVTPRQRPHPTPTGTTLRRELGNQRMLGMSLDAGGHLTHGFRPNISGKMFDQRCYGTDPDDRAARLRRGARRWPGSSSR